MSLLMFSLPRTKHHGRRVRLQGFTLIELMVATAVILIVGIAGVQALAMMNSKAAAMRILNNARAAVQRDIDTAMGVPYTTTSVPAILATTPGTGTVYVDSGTGNLETVVLMSNGTTPLIQGTMTRTVVAQANSENQALLSITFSLTYTYRKHNYTYSMTTLRAPDS
jgi:prepilin-type N-terminal cleavage/methylation domain-containing protein